MNILEKIVTHKKLEVEKAKQQVSIGQLESSIFFQRNTISLTENLLQQNSNGIIAEFKRQSPSKGILNKNTVAEVIVKQYEEAGVCGSSVLTDKVFFGGSADDLM